MRNKKIAITVALMLGLASLWGCGEDNSAPVDSERIVEEQTMENKENDASEPLSSDAGEADSRFQLNQIVEFELDNGGKMNVTLTRWGKGNEMYNNEPYVWIAYTIENTGEEKITVGNSLFTIYADDYVADSLVFSEDNKGVAVAELSSGRKVDGELYAAIDPEKVSVIEVELWNAVFVIKDNEVGVNESDMQSGSDGSAEDNGNASNEEWNLGEFSEDWYKDTLNFEDSEGNTLEIIYDDYGELQFAINGSTLYYGMASEHTDYGDGIYIYMLKDDSGNEVTMLYYPKDTVQIDSMVFTAVR